jgi:diguanylate cyclase (GGDEF)-like protein
MDPARTAFDQVRFRFPSVRLSIAAKLYCVSFLSFVAVGTLALASIYFARSTETAARHLYEDGFVGVESSSRLELLLEQHRRIVQSAPAEVERQRLDAGRRELSNLIDKVEELLNEGVDDKGKAVHAGALTTKISQLLPELAKRAQIVIFFAENFAQDKALEASADYARIADGIQEQLLAYRAERLKIADTAVTELNDSARALIVWALGSTLVALLVLIPLGLLIMRGVLGRLARITNAMIRLAQHDTTVDVTSRADRDEVGDMARAVEVFKANAVELLQRKVQLEQVNLQLDVALNNMSHGLCMFDSDARLIVSNAAYIRMYDVPQELTKPGTPLARIVEARIARSTIAIAHNGKAASQRVDEIANMAPCTFTQELVDHRIVAVSHQPMADGGWVSVHEDITDRRRVEAQIAHMARHDVLTDLPNRVLLREHLEQAITRMQEGEKFAVLCLDLDRFKSVNDTLGHPVGDELLKAVGRRLKKCVGPMDTVSRLGGDEFAIIQVGVTRPELTSALAARIVEVISEPYELDGNHAVVGTSIGIALAPGDGTDPDQLLKNADMALYLAKADGRGTHRFFEPEMDARLQARRSLELDLRHAITHGEFELAYQPVVSLPKQDIVSFEALLRWSHPERGMISPADFIPLAEETGLIVQLGEWVLRTACAEAANWPDEIRVAVNLSPVQFKKRNLVQVVIGALAGSGILARRLELEITESVLLQDDEMTLAMLHQLRSLGMCISMDDFGTGYSSLSYLRRFPFDKIKIDQSFIRDLAKRHDSTAIVRAVASLAHSLKIIAVAEGVETADQLQQAQAEGCTQAQGYLFGAPMPASKIPELLARRRAVTVAA